MITKARLLSTVKNLGPFYLKLIQEFIVNLPTDLNEPDTPNFRKVHVLGKCFNISPAILNSFMKLSLLAGFVVTLPSPEELALKLSGETIKVWPTDGQFPAIKLSVKYVILHKIGITNWYPSTHFATISTSLA